MRIDGRLVAVLLTATSALAVCADAQTPGTRKAAHHPARRKPVVIRPPTKAEKYSLHGPTAAAVQPRAVPALPTSKQAHAAGYGGEVVGEKITVLGIKQSIARAINIKRHADGVVDVITAEDVGKFPSMNTAEALSHLPGVSVDHMFGEGEKVSINGTDPALNRIFVDGHDIASADWGGNPNDPTSRTFNYSFLAPEVIETLRVYKSSEAWLDEGSLGGSVIVDTRTPLTMRANTAMVSVGWLYNQNSDKSTPRGSALYSWHNKSGTFGIMLSGGYQDEKLARAGVEIFGYGSGSSFLAADPAINGGTAADLAAARYPAGINAAYFQQTRERQTYQARVQYKLTPELTLDFSAVVIHGNYENYNQSEYVDASWAASVVKNVSVRNGIVTQANFGSTQLPSTTAELDSIYRKSPMDNFTWNFAPKWDHGEWHVTTNAGYTRAIGGTDPYYMLSAQSNVPWSYSYNSANQVSINYAQSPTDPATFSRNDVSTHVVGNRTVQGIQVGGAEWDMTYDSEVYGQAAIQRDLNWWVFKDIKFGAKYSDHDNNIQASGISTFANDSFNLGNVGYTLTPAGIYSGLGFTGNATQYASIPAERVVTYLASQTNYFTGTDYGATEDVREQIRAGYAQLDLQGHHWRGNIGLRLVSTTDTSRYFETTDGGTTYLPVTTNNTYFKPLPNLNLIYTLAPDVLARFSAAEVIARPRYANLAGAVSRDDQTQTASGGNPNLKPYQALNLEGSLEWYFAKGSLLDAEIFFRDISNYILNTTTEQTLYNRLRAEYLPYQVSGPINAGKAKVEGFAPSLNWAIWHGFGIQTNYTLSFAQTANGSYNMPYLSRHTVNVAPYYEYGRWQTRLSFAYRTHYFTEIGYLNANNMTAGYKQLDYSLSYNFYKTAVATFTASNLLNSTYFEYASTKNAPIAYYKSGRFFGVNISYKY